MKIHTLDLDFLDLHEAIAAYVIETTAGPILIECGPASTLAHLELAFAQKGWKKSDFKHVFLSHIHFDHAGAAWAFAESGAKVYVHPKGLPHLAAPEKLYNSARMIYGDDMDRLWGPMHPIPEAQLYAPEHGETIVANGLNCRAWYTPGHAVHHIAWEISDGAQKVLFTGDVAGVKIGAGPVVPPCPPPDINIEDWQASLELMRNLDVEDLYLTHFGLIVNKLEHLHTLEQRLLAWANWMRPYAEQHANAADVVPQFQAYAREELLQAGVDEAGLERYEAANPAFMSVAGLLRYWHKSGKLEPKNA